MSISAMVAVRDHSKLQGSRLLLLLMIADALNDDEISARCSVDTLCARARVDRRQVKRFFYDLVHSNELVIVTRPGKTNIYYIPLLQGEEGYAPEECNDDDHDCGGKHTPLTFTRERTPHPAPRMRREPKAPGVSKRRGARTPTDLPKKDGGAQAPLQGGLRHPYRGGSGTPTGGASAPPDPSLIPYLSHRDPSAHARTREITPHQKNSEATDPEAPITAGTLALVPTPVPQETPTPPLPPSPSPRGRPARGERVTIWRDICDVLSNYGVTPVQVEQQMRCCHLYMPNPGQWQLYVPRGHNADIFKTRYDTAIVRALEGYLERGNQIVEYVG